MIEDEATFKICLRCYSRGMRHICTCEEENYTEIPSRLFGMFGLLHEAIELLKELQDHHNNPPWHHVTEFLKKVGGDEE